MYNVYYTIIGVEYFFFFTNKWAVYTTKAVRTIV